MPKVFNKMVKRAAKGRRSSVNASLAGRVEQLEVFAFEVAHAILNDTLTEEDAKEACAEYSRFVEECRRAR